MITMVPFGLGIYEQKTCAATFLTDNGTLNLETWPAATDALSTRLERNSSLRPPPKTREKLSL